MKPGEPSTRSCHDCQNWNPDLPDWQWCEKHGDPAVDEYQNNLPFTVTSNLSASSCPGFELEAA